jgi:hypothetical protein
MLPKNEAERMRLYFQTARAVLNSKDVKPDSKQAFRNTVLERLEEYLKKASILDGTSDQHVEYLCLIGLGEIGSLRSSAGIPDSSFHSIDDILDKLRSLAKYTQLVNDRRQKFIDWKERKYHVVAQYGTSRAKH